MGYSEETSHVVGGLLPAGLSLGLGLGGYAVTRWVSAGRGGWNSATLGSGTPTTGIESIRFNPAAGRFYLIGEEIQSPWVSLRAGVVVEELPGPVGRKSLFTPSDSLVPTPALIPREMASLARHFDDVEFALLRRELADGSHEWALASGRAGEFGQVNHAGFGPDWELIYHTHPPGPTVASLPDQATLRYYGQSYSEIVLPDGTTVGFSVTRTQGVPRPVGSIWDELSRLP